MCLNNVEHLLNSLTTKTIKTILFASLTMILLFSGMDFEVVQKAFAMQHVMIDDMHFHGMDHSTKRVITEATQMVRDSKATSFNPIYFDRSYTDEIQDRSLDRR